jgi:hypothetical protein
MGQSFAAGTTDGPGAFDFQQGTTTNNSNPLWELVGGILHNPNEEQEACHAPKPILLDTGYVRRLFYPLRFLFCSARYWTMPLDYGYEDEPFYSLFQPFF